MGLHDSGRDRDAYERPNQDWVCGRSTTGRSCKAGPDENGRCRASFDCLPQKHGDRWVCTRSDKCVDGPLPHGSCSRPKTPCQPRLSLRARRTLTVHWAIALALAVALLLMLGNGSPTQMPVQPGALSFAHGSVTTSCGDCHRAGSRGGVNWLQAAFDPVPGAIESDRCLKCHPQGSDPLAPHAIGGGQRPRPAGTGASRPSGIRAVVHGLADALWRRDDRGAAGMACATCHREHRGKLKMAVAMDGMRCQSCHRARFNTFQDGHPEFDDYPGRGRSGLRFDHARHLKQHFIDQRYRPRAPRDCHACHHMGPTGGQMTVRSFDTLCAACHAGQINGRDRADSPGIAVFALPGLDLDTLAAHGVAVGQWPTDAEGDLTAFMRLLLADQDSPALDWQRLDGLDLMDLEGADPETLAEVGRMAWSVKGLFATLLDRGQADFQQRLSRVLGQPLTAETAGNLMAHLPRAVLEDARQAWFPELYQELADRLAGHLETLAPTHGAATPQRGAEEGSGPSPDAAAGRLPVDGEDRPPAALDDDRLAGGGDDELLAGEEEDLLAGEEEDLLAGEEENLLAGEEENLLAGEEEDLLAGEDDDLLDSGDDLLEEELPEAGTPASTPPVKTAAKPVAPPDWVTAGGWYRFDFGLHYRPGAHADPFIRSWLVTGGMIPVADGSAVLSLLAAKDAPGACFKCHRIRTIERRGATVTQVPWNIAATNPTTRSSTRFSHRPHLNLPGGIGCTACHVLRTDGVGDKPEGGPADSFQAMTRQGCANCHTDNGAGQDCLKCHPYHRVR